MKLNFGFYRGAMSNVAIGIRESQKTAPVKAEKPRAKPLPDSKLSKLADFWRPSK